MHIILLFYKDVRLSIYNTNDVSFYKLSNYTQITFSVTCRSTSVWGTSGQRRQPKKQVWSEALRRTQSVQYWQLLKNTHSISSQSWQNLVSQSVIWVNRLGFHMTQRQKHRLRYWLARAVDNTIRDLAFSIWSFSSNSSKFSIRWMTPATALFPISLYQWQSRRPFHGMRSLVKFDYQRKKINHQFVCTQIGQVIIFSFLLASEGVGNGLEFRIQYIYKISWWGYGSN